MTQALLVLNAGSSSIKFSIFGTQPDPDIHIRGQIEGLLSNPKFVAQDRYGVEVEHQTWPADSQLSHSEAVRFLIGWIAHAAYEYQVLAVGHRVVHGGTLFDKPVVIDATILNQLESLIPLAPLHQAHNLAAIQAVSDLLPGLPQVACFDTAFHRYQPAVAQAFALPARLSQLGLQRYGFHGLSYEYISSRFTTIDPIASQGRVIVAHLGNGCSMCAMQAGHSVATSMGFSTLDGLPMGTRSGSLDPGVLLYLLQEQSLDIHQLEHILYHESGLLGMSGVSSDMRILLDQELHNPHAAAAIEYFVYRANRELGSLAAAMGGVDAVIFTAGIGEHASSIRARICQSAQWLGLRLDSEANQTHGPQITYQNSPVSAWVIPTNEEVVIARSTQCLVS